MGGTYTVTVTANGCSSVSSTVVVITALPTATATSNSPVCAGGTINLFTPTVSGATFAWTGPLAFTSTLQNPTRPGATVAMSGTYQVTVTRSGCSATSSVVVTVNANPTATASAVNALCNNVCNGSATVTPAGGAGGYTYLWSASAGSQTTATASGLCDGVYTVVITDAAGCIVNSGATVSEPTALSITSISTTQSSCAASNGTATVNATGGTTAYSYSLNAGTPQASNAYSSLAAGAYTMLVTDANGCMASSNFAITNPNSPVVTNSSTATSCASVCDGSGTVNISGGTAPFSVDWCGTGTQSGITASATNNTLCAGTCAVVITDAAGCVTTSSVTIATPTAVAATMNASTVSCESDCDGVGTITVSGGTAPYSVDWCDGNTSTNITSVAVNSGLCGGACAVTITDANGCMTTATATVPEPSILGSTETHVDEVAGNDGSINLTITGGTGPYSVSWSSGQGIEDISGLAGGSYTATITDANGCTTQITVIVASTVGIKENVSTLISIYPNPNTGMFTIDLGKSANGTFELFDMQGKLIYSSTLTSAKTDLNLQIASGIYNLRINNADGIINHKLIIQN
jgi:hypothetical protein